MDSCQSSKLSSLLSRTGSSYETDDMVLDSIRLGRQRQEKYGEMRKLEEECRQKFVKAQKIKEELWAVQTSPSKDRDVTEEAPYDAKRSKQLTCSFRRTI